MTVVERGSAPLVGALGGVIGEIAAEMQRDHGVDLRCGMGVSSLEGDSGGHVRRVHLSDGTTVDADVVVASLGSIRNVEWLEGAGLASGFWGVGCDAGGRAFDINGVVTDSIWVAGDVARAPHVLYEYQFLAMEHWDNAVLGAEAAAHNMVNLEPHYRPHLLLPGFWSGQFGVNIKSVGVPPFGDEIVFTQGSVKERHFAAAYGRRGRIVAAVTFDHGKWLEYYGKLIEQSGPFPPPPPGWDQPPDMKPMPAEFPQPGVPTALPDVVLTGHDPSERGPSSGRALVDAPAGSGVQTDSNDRRKEGRLVVEETPWQQALRYANRANPYPFYEELRRTPVARQPDGTYVVSTYQEIVALLHDPGSVRMSGNSPPPLRPRPRARRRPN